MKKFLVIAGLMAAMSSPASAGSIFTVVCEPSSDGTGTTVNAIVQGTPSSSAVITIDSVTQTAAHTVDGSSVSVTVSGEVACASSTVKVVDGSTTYTQ